MSAELTDDELHHAREHLAPAFGPVFRKLLRAYESLAAELANARGPEPFAESAAAGLGPLLESERTAHEQTKALLENALANCLHAQRERDTARELELELADELHSMCDRVLAVDSALATALKLLQRWKNKPQRDARSSSTGLLWADTAAYLSSHPTPVAAPLGPKHCGFCQRAPCECHYEPVAAPCAGPPAAAGLEPSAEPMPEGWTMRTDAYGLWFKYGRAFELSLGHISALLATQGLAVVPVADVVTAEERRVLDLCIKWTRAQNYIDRGQLQSEVWEAAFALASRGAKGGKP